MEKAAGITWGEYIPESVKGLSGIAGFVTAICLASGVFIRRYYLSTVGISDDSILQTRDVLTGGIFWVLIATGYLTIQQCLVPNLVGGDEPRWKKHAARPIVVIMGILLISLVLLPTFEHWRSSILVAVVWVVLFFPVHSASTLAFTNPESTDTGMVRLIRQCWRFLCIVLLVSLMCLDANAIYPWTPTFLGGGRSEVVQLLPANDAAEQLQRLGIVLDSRTRLSERVEILYDGESYLLAKYAGKRLRINKSLVSAIVIP